MAVWASTPVLTPVYPLVPSGECHRWCHCDITAPEQPWQPPGGALAWAVGEGCLLIVGVCLALLRLCLNGAVSATAPRRVAVADARPAARRIALPRELELLAVDAESL